MLIPTDHITMIRNFVVIEEKLCHYTFMIVTARGEGMAALKNCLCSQTW